MACVRGPLGHFALYPIWYSTHLETAFLAASCHSRYGAHPRWLAARRNDSLSVSRDTPAVVVSWPKLCFRFTVAARNQLPKGVARADSLFFRGCDFSASTGEEVWSM